MSARPLLFSDPLARWITLAVYLVWIGAEARSLRRSGSTDRVQDGGTKLFLAVWLAIAVVAAIAVARLVPGFALPGSAWVTFSIGVCVALGGIALRQWAIAMLGRLFTRDVMIREDHHVVTRGPYRYIRHPAYAGTMLTMLGYGVMLQSWLSLGVTFAGFVVSHLPRILHEEHVLESNLGEPYRAFEHGRKRLVPRVW